MKALIPLRFYLILLLFSSPAVLSEVAAQQLVALSKCGTEMDCFASSTCIFGTTTKIVSVEQVKDDCPAILKIRAYSNEHWLVVLKSLNPAVTDISVTLNSDNLLSCVKGGTQLIAKYKDDTEHTELLSSNESPLKCEFLVQKESMDMILQRESGEVALKTKELSTLGIDADSFLNMVSVTCDPLKSKQVELQINEELSIAQVESKYSMLKCPKKYHLEYEKDNKFMKVDSIKCEKNSDTNNKYAYLMRNNGVSEIVSKEDKNGKFGVRCVVPTCSLCDYTPPTSSDSSGLKPEIKDEKGSCKEMQCGGEYLKANVALNKEQFAYGNATCQSVGNKHDWYMNDQKIDLTTAECVGKVEYKPDLAGLCGIGPDGSRCIVADDDLPYCSNNRLKIDGKNGTITTDESSGQYKLNATKFPDHPNLSCETIQLDTSAKADAQIITNEAESKDNVVIILGVLAVLLLIALALLVFYACWRWRKGRKKCKNISGRREDASGRGQNRWINEVNTNEFLRQDEHRNYHFSESYR